MIHFPVDGIAFIGGVCCTVIRVDVAVVGGFGVIVYGCAVIRVSVVCCSFTVIGDKALPVLEDPDRFLPKVFFSVSFLLLLAVP